MSVDRLSERSGGVIGPIGPIGGSGVFSLQERYALTADNYEDVSLYLKMNGANGSTTFYDSSLYGHTVTANGDAQISTTQSKFGGASAVFDGTGDYLSVPDDAAFAFGSGDFTIEGWFYLNAIPSASDGMALLGQWATTGTFAFILQVFNNAGQLQMVTSYSADGSSETQTDAANITVSGSQWYHFALSRTGGFSRHFLNGVEVGSFSNSVNIFNSATPLNIGRHGGNIRYLNGYIDDLRITKGVARYTGNFTPPQREFRP